MIIYDPKQIVALPSFDLVRVRAGKPETVKVDKGFNDSEVSARANGLRSMMGKFAKRVWDVRHSEDAFRLIPSHSCPT
jgi:hypothetical protein